MYKKFLFKITAVFLNLLIIAAGMPILAPAAAQAEQVIAARQASDGFNTVCKEDFTDPQEKFSESIPYVEQRYKDTAPCGVALHFSGGAYERAVFTAEKYNIDGFYLRIDSIVKKNSTGSAPKFSILVSKTGAAGRFILLFDTQNGTVYRSGENSALTALITNDALKYASLAANGFDIGFKAKENGALALEITARDGKYLTADIPGEYAVETGKNAASSYIGISPFSAAEGTTDEFTVNISAIKYDEYTRPISSTLIKQVSNGKNRLLNGNYGSFPCGMVSEFSGTDIGSRHVSAEKYPIDGLRLRFGSFKKTEGYESENAELAITLTQSADSIGAVRIVIDTDNKTLGYYTAGVKPVTIISGEELSYDNISANEFVVGFNVNLSGECTVFIAVGNAPALYGTIPSSFFSLINGCETARFTVSPANSINYFSVKTTGIYVEKQDGGFTVPDKRAFKEITGITDNIPEKTTVFDGWEAVGTRLTFSGGDVGRRITTEDKYNFDGLSLKFSNLKKNSNAYGALRFAISAAEQTEALGRFRVMADTAEGTLSFYNAEVSPTVFLSSDLLKYENISQTDFIMSFYSLSDGGMKCIVKVKGKNPIYGTIPASFCGSYANKLADSYITVAPGKAIDDARYYFSVDITGIKSDKYTVPSGAVLRKTVGSGNSLIPLKNGVFAAGESSVFTNVGANARQCSREKYNVNGLSLRFGGLSALWEEYPVMAVMLTEDINAAYGNSLYIDTSAGALCFNNAENILLKSEVLQYKRLQNREFTLMFDGDGNGNVSVTVSVRGYAQMKAVLPLKLPENNIYFAIAPGGVNSFSVTLTGILCREKYINNSYLLPQYKCDGLISTYENGTPEWLSSAVIGETNVSIFGTFYDMLPLLDHCAETGINALWLTPVSDKGENGNGYSNMGIKTIDPYLTGLIPYGENWRQLTDEEYEKGWQVFSEFVKEAHKRNIRILFDVVSFGVLKESPLISEHPEWFKSYSQEVTCRDFRWDNAALAEYYINALTQIAVKTGIDGLRFDSEPQTAGYEIDGRIRKSISAAGRKLIYFAETKNNDNTVYDLSEGDVQGPDYISVKHFESVFLKRNIVDSIKNGIWIGAPEAQDIHKSGEFRYYTFQLCCHDSYEYSSRGDRLIMGYEALFSPFIPVWVMGEEFNNAKDGDYTRILYLNTFKRELLKNDDNRRYFEDVKKMIEIRRTYSDIFEYFPKNHKNSNICKAEVSGGAKLQAYARYYGNRGIIIIPNETNEKTELTVTPRLYEMGLSGYEAYTVTDLSSGKLIASGTEEQILSFAASVNARDTGKFLITGSGERGAGISKPIPEEPEDDSDRIEYTAPICEYFIPDTGDFTDFGTFWHDNIPEIKNIINNGVQHGVMLTYNGGDVGRRITSLKKYRVDGFSLKFERLTKNDGCTGDPSVTVMLSKTIDLDKFRIMIDTSAGTLSYYNGATAPTEIARSDKLKYSELSQSSFTVTFSLNTDGSVICSLNTGGTEICGVIPSSFAALMGDFGTEQLYFAVGPGRADPLRVYNFSVELTGIYQKTEKTPDETQMTKVTDGAAASFEDYIKGSCRSGVSLSFEGCDIGGCIMYSEMQELKGLKLSFAGLEKNEGYEDNLLKFSICIGDSAQKLPKFRVVFDTLSGTVSYYSGSNPYGNLTAIAEDDILKYKNLHGHPFEVLFGVNDAGDVTVTFTLGQRKITGIIPKKFRDLYLNGENVYFGISSSNRSGYFSVALTGIEKMYTLTFLKNRFNKGEMLVPQDAEYRLPAPAHRNGYAFMGWRDIETGVCYAAGARLKAVKSADFAAYEAYPGDIDCNGVRQAADLIILRKYILGAVKYVAATADANCDGIIDIRDVISLKKIISQY